jgi:excisionase family DNA binding protein
LYAWKDETTGVGLFADLGGSGVLPGGLERRVDGRGAYRPGDREAMMRLLNKDEVAELLGVSVRTVERLRGRGLLPWIKLLGAIRFRTDDVQSLIDSQRRQEPSSR